MTGPLGRQAGELGSRREIAHRLEHRDEVDEREGRHEFPVEGEAVREPTHRRKPRAVPRLRGAKPAENRADRASRGDARGRPRDPRPRPSGDLRTGDDRHHRESHNQTRPWGRRGRDRRGDAEERAAAFIAEYVTKPVVGYVAGFTAPEGKTMGHAGAIVSGSSGTAQAKKDALEAAGVKVGQTPSETARLMRAILGR